MLKPDNNWDHLYPPFRSALRRVLLTVAEETKEEWVLVEGYRSVARQLWLFAQGRTRPGKIVTWIRSPKWHGTGLAADVMPKKSGYGAPRKHWETLRKHYLKIGLDNPAWHKGDLGHIQMSDNALRLKALRWIKNGFKE